MTNPGVGWIYQGSVAYWGLIKGHYQCQNGTEQRPLKVRGKQTCDLQRNTYLILRISQQLFLKSPAGLYVMLCTGNIPGGIAELHL